MKDKINEVNDEASFYWRVLELFKRTEVSNKEQKQLKRPTTALVYSGDCYNELVVVVKKFIVAKVGEMYVLQPKVLKDFANFQGLVTSVVNTGGDFLKIEKDGLVFQMFIAS